MMAVHGPCWHARAQVSIYNMVPDLETGMERQMYAAKVRCPA